MELSADQSALLLLKKLNSLVARTYWTPRVEVDGQQAVSRGKDGNGEVYLVKLRASAVDYIRSVNELCTKSTIVAKHLDEPNLHRLLELYTHTLPSFGHVNHFMELVFECAHQPLKRCITLGNHRNDHLAAMEHCLANDWQARLMLLRRETESADQQRKRKAMLGLKRLLLGAKQAESRETDDELDQAIVDAFIGPVESILKLQSAPMTLRSQETSTWLGRGKSIKCDSNLQGTGLEEHMESDVLHKIWELYTYVNPIGTDSISGMLLYKEMTRRLKGISGDTRTTATGVGQVGVGNVVQVLATREAGNSSLITTSTATDAIAAIYCVVCIIDDGEHGVVAAVLRCDVEGGLLRTRNRLKPNSIQLLSVNGHLRRVGTAHACNIERENGGETCLVRDHGRTVIHTKTIMERGVYYYFIREMGYPPRMA